MPFWGHNSTKNSKIRGVASKSLFGGLPEVEIQQNIANWKAESLSFSVSKEFAPEDASSGSYGDFESNLRRRASGAKINFVALSAKCRNPKV